MLYNQTALRRRFNHQTRLQDKHHSRVVFPSSCWANFFKHFTTHQQLVISNGNMKIISRNAFSTTPNIEGEKEKNSRAGFSVRKIRDGVCWRYAGHGFLRPGKLSAQYSLIENNLNEKLPPRGSGLFFYCTRTESIAYSVLSLLGQQQQFHAFAFGQRPFIGGHFGSPLDPLQRATDPLAFRMPSMSNCQSKFF